MESDSLNILPHGYDSQQGELAQSAANQAPPEFSVQGGQEGGSHSTATMLETIASWLEVLDAQRKLIATNLPLPSYRFLVDIYNWWVSRARQAFDIIPVICSSQRAIMRDPCIRIESRMSQRTCAP